GQVAVEVVDHTHPRLLAQRPQILDVRQCGPGLEPVLHQPPGGAIERSLRVHVRELEPRDLAEARGRLREICHSRPRARTLARCATGTPLPAPSARPRRWRRQPGSAVTRPSALAAPAGLSSALAPATPGWRTG